MHSVSVVALSQPPHTHTHTDTHTHTHTQTHTHTPHGHTHTHTHGHTNTHLLYICDTRNEGPMRYRSLVHDGCPILIVESWVSVCPE